MIKFTANNTGQIVDVIVELVPEFKEYKEFESEYMVEKDFKSLLLDIFGRFFKERIENYAEDDPIIQRVFKFLNAQFNESESNKDMVGYLGQEIFENIASSRKGTEVTRKFLQGKALEAFNASAEYFGIHD